MPKTEISCRRSSTKYTPVFTITPSSMEKAARCGAPCAVKQAESVCTHERVNALNEKIRISSVNTDNSSTESERKIIFAACPAKRYKANAQGRLTAAVINREKRMRLRRCSPLLAAATAGILAAAMP